MRQEKRKDRRRIMHFTASIVLGAREGLSCAILDVSDTGARLELETPAAVPDRFPLVLSGNGTPHRNCRVIWRDGKRVGVTFENRPPLAERLT